MRRRRSAWCAIAVFALGAVWGCHASPAPSGHAASPTRTTTAPPLAGSSTPTTSVTSATGDVARVRPRRDLTPGVVNPDVTQATIHSTICVTGWTKTVRPPESYTSALKRRQIAAYGYHDTNPAHYEEDHLIPLELGGAPRDPKNLWPEPGASPNPKDADENRLHTAVCSGTLTLDEARAQLLRDWGPA